MSKHNQNRKELGYEKIKNMVAKKGQIPTQNEQILQQECIALRKEIVRLKQVKSRLYAHLFTIETVAKQSQWTPVEKLGIITEEISKVISGI